MGHNIYYYITINKIYIFSSSDTWIGLNDIDSEGNMVWEDGTSLNYQKWEGSYSNPSDKDCVFIGSGKTTWIIDGCDKQIAYICSSPVSQPAPGKYHMSYVCLSYINITQKSNVCTLIVISAHTYTHTHTHTYTLLIT